MGKAFKRFIGLSIAATAGAMVFYKHVLTEDNRESLRKAVQSAKGLYEDVAARVAPMVEDAKVSMNDHTNRELTKQQWEDLGY